MGVGGQVLAYMHHVIACVGSMDSQMAEWILTKLSKHDPWVPTKLKKKKKKRKKKNSENVTPGEGKRNLNFPLEKRRS